MGDWTGVVVLDWNCVTPGPTPHIMEGALIYADHIRCHPKWRKKAIEGMTLATGKKPVVFRARQWKRLGRTP